MFRRLYIKWLVWRGKAVDIWSKSDYPADVLSNLCSNGFRFDGVTDGIDGVEVDRNKSHDLYNLIGQRVVGKAAPGLYVVNGKKVIIR